MIEPLIYFWLLLKASLLSTSGTGNLPILHEDLIARGWADERQFGESLAVGQISPGPSGLWVIGLGYLTYGLPGALLATLAITIPPLLVLLIELLYRRIGRSPLTHGFVRGLSLGSVGVFLIVLSGIFLATGVDLRSLLIGVIALALALTRRVPVIAVLGMAAAAGILLY
jgi:chromate transporter